MRTLLSIGRIYAGWFLGIFGCIAVLGNYMNTRETFSHPFVISMYQSTASWSFWLLFGTFFYLMLIPKKKQSKVRHSIAKNTIDNVVASPITPKPLKSTAINNNGDVSIGHDPLASS